MFLNIFLFDKYRNILLIEIKEYAILVLFLKFEVIKLLTLDLFAVLLMLKSHTVP